MKRIVKAAVIILFIFLIFNINVIASINYFDGIANSDEYLIKAFRSHHNYSTKELKKLAIEYLGEVDSYRIYFVPIKKSYSTDPWVKDGFVFPPESHSRIIGIKNGSLFVLGKMLFESSIDVESFYDLIKNKL